MYYSQNMKSHFSLFLGVPSRQCVGAGGQSQHHCEVQHQTSGPEGRFCTGTAMLLKEKNSKYYVDYTANVCVFFFAKFVSHDALHQITIKSQ